MYLAERFDDDGAEEILAAHHQPGEGLPHFRIGAVGRERARQRRPDELGLLALQRREQARHDAKVLMVLEPPVRGRTNAVIALVERLEHDVGNARVVEAREHDQRLETDVRVGVAADSFDQRRHCEGRVSAAHRPGGIHTDRKIHRAEQIDRRLELRRGDLFRDGGRPGGCLGGCLGGDGRRVKHGRQGSDNESAPRQDHSRVSRPP